MPKPTTCVLLQQSFSPTAHKGPLCDQGSRCLIEGRDSSAVLLWSQLSNWDRHGSSAGRFVGFNHRQVLGCWSITAFIRYQTPRDQLAQFTQVMTGTHRHWVRYCVLSAHFAGPDTVSYVCLPLGLRCLLCQSGSVTSGCFWEGRCGYEVVTSPSPYSLGGVGPLWRRHPGGMPPNSPSADRDRYSVIYTHQTKGLFGR